MIKSVCYSCLHYHKSRLFMQVIQQ